MNGTIHLWLLWICVALGIALGSFPASAGTPVALYTFQGGSDGAGAFGPVADLAGNLYGVTQNGGVGNFGTGNGVVWKLAPPTGAGGGWTETILYKFTGGSDGAQAFGTLVIDSLGNLYGTTAIGGDTTRCLNYGCGVVFKLSPAPGGGDWTETVLYPFRGNSDGEVPEAGVVFDQAGNLYGTTTEGGVHSGCCGTIFELSAPASGSGPWTHTTLYKFNGVGDGREPLASLTLGKNGILYGTAANGGARENCCGVAFMLSPPIGGSSSWSYTVLNAFSGPDGLYPHSSLVFDTAGINLYGTAPHGAGNGLIARHGCGVAYELSPPGSGSGPWTYTRIHRFGASPDGCEPFEGLVFGPTGKLYGTTNFSQSAPRGGVAFELTPQGKTKVIWKEAATPFQGALAGGDAGAALIFDPPVGGASTLYGTCLGCGTSALGAVYAWTP